MRALVLIAVVALAACGADGPPEQPAGGTQVTLDIPAR